MIMIQEEFLLPLIMLVFVAALFLGSCIWRVYHGNGPRDRVFRKDDEKRGKGRR